MFAIGGPAMRGGRGSMRGNDRRYNSAPPTRGGGVGGGGGGGFGRPTRDYREEGRPER